MAFTVRAQVSQEAEATARLRFATDIDNRITVVLQQIFDSEVAEVLRDFDWQGEALLSRNELEAVDAVRSGVARANQLRVALQALQKIKAAA